MKPIPRIALLCLLIIAAFAVPNVNGSGGTGVVLVGQEQVVFSTLTGTINGVNYPCGFIPRTATGWNYTVDNEPYFDGPVAPISYMVGSTKKLHFNVSVGYKNYRVTSTLTGSGDSASVGAGTLDCNPVFVAALSYPDDIFAWGEWLYGTFRDVPSGKVYSHIYNEYYGGYYPGQDGYGAYVASGLAVSTNNGATFSRIQSAPNHVILRSVNLRQPIFDVQGYSCWPAIFKSPLDQLYYMASGGTTGTTMMRTNNLDDPLSWRAWDGSAFSLPTVPLSGTSQTIEVNPLYIGYSDYFKKYISVTIGSDEFANGRHNLIVYNLSDDMVHWGLTRKIMYNPACGPDHVCTGSEEPLPAYPSIMDPAYLGDTNDTTKASNGIIGARPYVTYIKNTPGQTIRQQLAIQKVSFENVAVNRMDNFSMRGIVGNGNENLVIGFIMQGTESKQFVFRGIGPSLYLPPKFGYSPIANPQISLYDAGGTLLASNLGWTTLPPADQAVLTSRGLAPPSTSESAIVRTLGPGAYTIKMDNGVGLGIIEGYDLSPLAEAKIAQVAVRGYSQPGNGALFLGFISRGGQVPVIRGTGASTLAPFGFSPVIPDPYLTVYRGAAQIGANDNWGQDPSWYQIQYVYQLNPGNALESATMLLPTERDSYTAILQGTGYGLLEVYNVNPN